LVDGEPAAVVGRAYDLLLALIDNRDRVVSKDELLAMVWPGAVVADSNLHTHVSAVRKMIGRKAIATIAGRGYRFVAPVEVAWEDTTQSPIEPLHASPPLHPAAEGSVASSSGQWDPMDAAILPSLPDKPSIAALPFTNHCNDLDQQYFVEGMMEEVIRALTRIDSLFVIASSATMSLKDRTVDLQSAARRLGVRYILEGSVRRAGSKVRIAVRLTDASSNARIWADRFEDTLEDVFALQDRVALGVASAIEPSVRAAELRRVARSPVENLGCYDLYLRASQLRASLQREDVTQALELLNRALALQPDFAPALAQAAGCHSQFWLNRWSEDPEGNRRQGLIMAERAERAGSGDASVLTQVANSLVDLDSHNIDRSIGLIDRATALNPGSAYAWFVSGFLRLMNGEGGAAVEHLEHALRLDPISPLSDVARAHMAVGKILEGAFEESLRIFRRTSYRTSRIHLALACAYGQLNEWPQAREELRHYDQLTTLPAEAMAEHSFHKADQKKWAIDMIARIRRTE
jgi:TolB-like protein/DNA-binding winged helix-turn-helix (wHTH) protein